MPDARDLFGAPADEPWTLERNGLTWRRVSPGDWHAHAGAFVVVARLEHIGRPRGPWHAGAHATGPGGAYASIVVTIHDARDGAMDAAVALVGRLKTWMREVSA